EQRDALEECFIELRWMPRRQNCAQRVRDLWLTAHRADDRIRCGPRRSDLRARCNCASSFLRMIEQFLRELHCPGNIADPTVKLAINEVRPPPEEQPNRRRYDEIVAEVQPRNFVTARVVKREQQQAQHPAVTRHSAFPN